MVSLEAPVIFFLVVFVYFFRISLKKQKIISRCFNPFKAIWFVNENNQNLVHYLLGF